MDSLLEMDAKKIKENKAKQEGGPAKGIMSAVEKNNLLLYRLKIYEEAGRWEDLIEFGKANSKLILDKLQYHRYLIKANQALEKWTCMRNSIDTLLQYIPENEEHITQFVEIGEKIGIAREESFEVLKGRNKRSKLIPKLILRSLEASDPKFREAIAE